jgi:hypothetical protein
MTKVYVLNSPVLTDWGKYEYVPIDVEKTKHKLEAGYVSAIGHEGTAKLLSTILGMEVPVNRVQIQMQPGDDAIVFQVLQRLPEGVVLTEEQLKKIPFRLGLLRRMS